MSGEKYFTAKTPSHPRSFLGLLVVGFLVVALPLLGNAVKFTPAGGLIRVLSRASGGGRAGRGLRGKRPRGARKR